jgi:ech hydrogenase subunit D
MNIATDQTIEVIPLESLLPRVKEMHSQNQRLVQICATRLPGSVELTYSFDLSSRLTNFRIQLPETEARIPSITSIYWGAFLYENEIHDLFNVVVEGIAVDFQGHLYQTAVKFPFGGCKAPAAGKNPAPAQPFTPAPAPSAASPTHPSTAA